MTRVTYHETDVNAIRTQRALRPEGAHPCGPGRRGPRSRRRRRHTNVEDAAAAASISRTTAYRYFPNERALLVAAHPEIIADVDASGEPAARSGGAARRRRGATSAP